VFAVRRQFDVIAIVAQAVGIEGNVDLVDEVLTLQVNHNPDRGGMLAPPVGRRVAVIRFGDRVLASTGRVAVNGLADGEVLAGTFQERDPGQRRGPPVGPCEQ
jgi:hypothetical protein